MSAPNPKVLIISGSYPPINCGIGFYTKRLQQAFEDIKFGDFAILTSTDVERSPQVLPWVQKWSTSSWPQVVRAIKQTSPNIIHIQYSSVRYGRRPFIVLLPYLLKSRFPKLKIVITIHEYHDASKLGQARVQSMIVPATKIVVSNQEDKIALSKRLAKRIELIPIGAMVTKAPLSTTEHSKLVKTYNLRHQTLLVSWGIIDQAKGTNWLVQAMRDLPDCKLVLVGKYNPANDYHKEIKHLIHDGIGNIDWPGFLSDADTSQLLQIANIVVLPYSQPVSLRRSTVISSLLHGKPVITTGPAKMPLQHKQNCFLIDSNDADTIVNAVEQLRNQPKLARMIGERAAQLAADFNWERIAQRHVELYQKILEKS